MEQSGTMADTPDLETLARDYMDLWQDHVNSLSKDENLTEFMANSLAIMNSGAATFAKVVRDAQQSEQNTNASDSQPDNTHANTENSDSPDTSPLSSSAGAATAGLPSEQPGSDMDQLLERIALLEKRVAELEHRAEPPRTRKIRTRKRTD